MKNKDIDGFAETVVLAIKRALEQPQERIQNLETHCRSLEQRNEMLEQRVLELEAQRAADHVAR